ncbi:MBL fold metallo-hydrolase [Sphingomonas sp. Leaf17]|uniref:N-acyl homoserine lactonase family protein n=1 Tax=Sphingomonas sp. Leaf17 TaxID=1735683 RepID=UPI0006FA1B8B|nr:N-acyl homoserine lactonase family protein [Sphingomonas sp. Leaf17]KQM64926.1 MBL fold metallo-hydrolase [Sphingomonas sp. Leaf17]
MKFVLGLLATGSLISGVAAYTAPADPSTKVTLTRLDCGSVAANDLNQFSDTDAYVGKAKRLVASCYLIRHGDTLMLWDAGLPAALKGKAIDPKLPMDATVRVTIAEQLAQLGIKPEQVTMLGVSHYHFDHIGQAATVPNATLLIGAKDWAALRASEPDKRVNPAPLAHWISGGGKVDPVEGDRDVFGDGGVRMVAMPGHTPDHHALLVKLADTGYVLLSGDTAHFRENYDSDGVPSFNTDRAATLASFKRFKALATNTKATVILQHDPADIAKLPAFPASAD